MTFQISESLPNQASQKLVDIVFYGRSSTVTLFEKLNFLKFWRFFCEKNTYVEQGQKLSKQSLATFCRLMLCNYDSDKARAKTLTFELENLTRSRKN